LYAFWRFLERGPDRLWWMLAGMLTVGLGILSKQTMIGFLALGGVFVLVSSADRRELRSPALWIWGLVSLAFLTPVVVWNYQHDWITVQHTGEHFSTETVSLGKRLARSGEFLATQLGVVAPLTWLLAIGVLATAAMAFRHLSRQAWFLLCFSGLPLAGVFVLSLRQRVEPNWPAAFYPAAVVLLVAWLLGRVQFSPRAQPRPRMRLLRNTAIAGGVASLLVYLLPFGLGWLGLQGSKLDPAVRLRGWRQLGTEVGRRIQPLATDEHPLVVVTTGRAVASELAFYLPDRPRVYVWNAGGHVSSQYDIWGGPRDQQGNDAVIVTHQDRDVPPEVAASFDRVEPLELVTVDIGNGRRHAYQLWQGIGLLRDGEWDMRSLAARREGGGRQPGKTRRIATQPPEEKPVTR
jgi:4-amino-4-deoxy-L-arabinose transferase-like glycosyltransferase